MDDGEIDITLVDRRNHHLFSPLLYQVATAALNPSDIAHPIRAVFRRQENVESVLMASVESIDLDAGAVVEQARQLKIRGVDVINVPDYPKLAQLWWQNIGDVNSGAFTPQQAMDRLASEMDQVMARMQKADEKAKVYGGCGPRLNDEKPAEEWLGKGGAKAKLANEKPEGETIAYDELIKRWSN